MPILDEDEFNKQAEKGNRKYLLMAERGEDYHIIRNTAKEDGLEGRELSMVMEMVDRVLISNAHIKSNVGNKEITIAMGTLLTLCSAGLMLYYFITMGGVVVFNIIILAISVSVLFRGITMK